MSEQTGKQGPEKEFRAGHMKSAVWQNESTQEDRTTLSRSVSIQKSFRDERTGAWKETNVLFARDIPNLILVAQKAYEYITLRESEDKF